MIQTVKETQSGYQVTYEDNTILSVPNDPANRHYQEVQEYINNGDIVLPEFSEEELLLQAEAEALQAKLKALATITVTTANGNTFNGDDVARADMVSAITSADTLGQTTTSWKLADNSWVTVDVAEMREALALAIQAKGAILAG